MAPLSPHPDHPHRSWRNLLSTNLSFSWKIPVLGRLSYLVLLSLHPFQTQDSCQDCCCLLIASHINCKRDYTDT